MNVATIASIATTAIGSIHGHELCDVLVTGHALLSKGCKRIFTVGHLGLLLPKGAKLCIYHRWYSPPDRLGFAPCYAVPMPFSR